MSRTRPARSVGSAVIVIVVAALALGLVPAPTRAHAATWTAPGFVRSIGARGEAGVYAWGMAYNPVTDEILVGDYWNFKIRRYDLEGHEVGAFYRSPALRKGQPYSISVDSRNGDIYVSEISDGKEGGWIARYDAQGTYLSDFQSDARYTAWHAADDNGYLYIADSHYWNKATDPPKIRKYNLSTGGSQVMSFGSYGSGPGQMGIVHGLATDAAGRIYAADAMNRRVSVYTPTGQFLYSFGSLGNGVGQFTGDLRGMALDKDTGTIYVVDAEAAEIEEFQMDANPESNPPHPVAHWGSEGVGPGQFADGGRAITIDGDHDVWVADYGNFRFLRYSPDGTLIGTYPSPAQDPVAGGFAQVRDVAVAPDGSVWTADTWNNRFQRFAADGTLLGAFGHRNSHPPYGMDYPRGVAVDPANGQVWVSSTRDHFIRVYDAGGSYLRTIGNGLDSTAVGSFRWPMDVEFAGTSAWVADYTSCKLKKVDTASGAELASISVCNNGIAIDPTTGNVLVLSWKYDRVYVYSSSGAYLRTWGSGGSGPGQFQNPWDIDVANITPGGPPTYRVFVSDSQLSRVEEFDVNGVFIGEWGTKGTGVFQLNQPSGISHDAQGRIYVADAANDRVQEFSFATPLPSGDATAPAVTLTSPAKNAVVPAATVIMTGTATDDVAVGSVAVSVHDLATNRWWNALDAVWGPTKTWNLAGYAGEPTTNVSFSFGFVGVGVGANYVAQTKVTDVAGNAKIGLTVPFSTDTGAPPDTVRPTVTVLSPAKDAAVPAGAVAIGGQANDDRAVASVEISIKDRGTGLWWNPGTGTWGTLKWMPVALSAPGTTATAWNAGWGGAVPGGAYFVQARVTDTSGNGDAGVHPSTRFTAV